MNARAHVTDEVDGLPTTDLMVLDGSLAIELNRVEIDQQIATARRFPRVISRVAANIRSLVTLDEETAEECMYALPRGGKPIKGPSIRFAEVVKATYGNNRSASRVIAVDRAEKVVIAEGIFHDLETNTATRSETRRRIVQSNGKIYNDDMIIMTGNAAGSIALRNAILGGVPKALWRGAYEAVQSLIAGDIKTLSETREKAIKALATFGVAPEQIFSAVGLSGIEDVNLDHIPVLRGMFSALKSGEETVESMFPKPQALTGAPNTALTDRLKAKQDGPKEGFNASNGSTASRDGDKPAGDAQAGDHDPKTGEVIEPKPDDGFPGDKPTTGKADAKVDPKPAPPKRKLSDRIAAFKVLVDEAETTVKAMQLKADNAQLWKDVDAGDPDEVGTTSELEAYLNDRCRAIEDAEKEASK